MGYDLEHLSGEELFDLACQYDPENKDAVVPDMIKAIGYYQLSAEKNYGPALVNLGSMYEDGGFFEQNFEKAFQYFKRAADQNFVTGQNALALMYITGRGTPKNIQKAIELLEPLAIIKNDLNAQRRLAYIFKNEQEFLNLFKARKYFALAIENGAEISFAIELAVMLFNGEGGEKDFEGAYGLFKQAALYDHSGDALYFMGIMHHHGAGVEKSEEMALLFFRESAALGNRNAISVLQ